MRYGRFLRVIRVVNRPSDALDQLSGVVAASHVRGGDPLVEGDRALTLGTGLAHHDDSRHDRLSFRWVDPRGPPAGQSFDGD